MCNVLQDVKAETAECEKAAEEFWTAHDMALAKNNETSEALNCLGKPAGKKDDLLKQKDDLEV